MSQQALIYSFVARGDVVLAEYTSFSGNFSTIAIQCLQKLPSGSNKFTYTCDSYTFNYLLDNGFVFLVVASESAGRQVPFLFLERVKDEFKKQYAKFLETNEADSLDLEFLQEEKFSIAYNLDAEFGPKLREHMQYCVDHPEELGKINKIKAQLQEVKSITMENIEKVLDRGEKIELLVDKTEGLQFQADNFQRQGRQLRRKIWFQNLKTKLIILGVIFAVILLLWLSVCKGFSCR